VYFSDFPGQDSTKTQLLDLFKSERVPHALLLNGEEGCGHLQLALSFSSLLLCKSPTPLDACKNCSSCKMYEKYQHPDLHFSYPIHLSKTEHSETSDDQRSSFLEALEKYKCLGKKTWYSKMGNENKQGVIGVKESQAILAKISLKSFFGSAKILLMWMPELMNIQAANKLLKLIEEPPENTYFIFVSNNQSKILPTISSRLQTINVPRLKDENISDFLEKKFQIEPSTAKNIAKISKGNLNKAINTHLDAGISEMNRSLFVNWMRLCYSRNIADTIDWVNEFSKIGREQIKDFIIYSLEMYRQCIMGNYNMEIEGVSESEKNFLEKFKPFVNHQNISKINSIMNDAYYHMERNANPKILMLDVSIKLYKLLRTK
jgi:DNA polymerase-3 subunit delta'